MILVVTNTPLDEIEVGFEFLPVDAPDFKEAGSGWRGEAEAEVAHPP